MKVTDHEFCKTIAEDYNIELKYKYKTAMNEFPIKDGKRKINASNDAIIVDINGNESPYMISKYIRNESKLIDFDHIYTIRFKHLDQIIKESGVKLRSESCKICEGGGWYTQGTRYFYKNIICEI